MAEAVCFFVAANFRAVGRKKPYKLGPSVRYTWREMGSPINSLKINRLHSGCFIPISENNHYLFHWCFGPPLSMGFKWLQG